MVLLRDGEVLLKFKLVLAVAGGLGRRAASVEGPLHDKSGCSGVRGLTEASAKVLKASFGDDARSDELGIPELERLDVGGVVGAFRRKDEKADAGIRAIRFRCTRSGL